MSAEEIQGLLQQIHDHRIKERDYTNLEDQIRCLQLRYEMLLMKDVSIIKGFNFQ